VKKISYTQIEIEASNKAWRKRKRRRNISGKKASMAYLAEEKLSQPRENGWRPSAKRKARKERKWRRKYQHSWRRSRRSISALGIGKPETAMAAAAM